MSEIKLYIPGGRTHFNPQGRPRVWFAAHPDDVNVCLPLLSEEILKISRCAIYYEAAEPEAPASAGEHVPEDQLAQMQLFVIPITTKLLGSDCRALMHDYGFAMEHHIPILPVMMEPELARYFTERLNKIGAGYGDIQFLDRTSADATEIAYQEKLEKRLASVLTEDKTAARVRAAFDAYIFLSYRKKDRAYAHELMRLIHRIPFCRDIAIWYDEFLVPGEEWSQTIADAMAKSALVTMAITPSITEPGNYIIEHEYPDAVAGGKTILPAQMSAVSEERRAQLQRLFPGLPELVDGHSTEEIAQILQQIAIRENDDNPEHNFLIGLAYLGAIDVERDADRALALITSAAEAGLGEAMAKLVSMYTNGEGVRCDYREAIRWQQKLTDRCRMAYRLAPNAQIRKALIKALRDLGDQLYAARRIAEAQPAYAEMTELCCEWAGQEDSADGKGYLAVAYDNLGRIERSLGHMAEAKGWYERCHELAVELAQETGTVEDRRNLAISYRNLGDMEEMQDHLPEARAWYEKSYELMLALVQETGTVRTREDLSVICRLLGDIEEDQGQLAAAAAWFEKCRGLCRELADETGSAEARKDLAVIYARLGGIRRAEGHLSEAEEWYRKSLEIRQELAQETGTVGARRYLALGYGGLGDIERERNRPAEAKVWYEKSLELRLELAQEMRTLQAREDLAVSYGCLGNIEEMQGHLPQAKDWYEKSLELNRELAEETHLVRARRDVAINCVSLGDIEADQGHLQEAKAWYKKSLSIKLELAEEAGTVEARGQLALSYERLGSIELRQRHPEEAKAYYEKSLKLREELAQETGTVDARRGLAVGYTCLGDVENGLRDHERARACYEQSLKLYRALAEETGMAAAWEWVASAYNKLGCIEVDLKHPDQARQWFEQSLKLTRALAEKTRTIKAYDEYAVSLVGMWQTTPGKLRELYLRQAIGIYARLAQASPSAVRYKQLQQQLQQIYEKTKAKK